MDMVDILLAVIRFCWGVTVPVVIFICINSATLTLTVTLTLTKACIYIVQVVYLPS